MQHKITQSGNQIVVELSGQMYVEDAAVLREALSEYLAKGHKQFLIQMNNVDYIDSSGLGVLVTIQKRALQAGGGVALTGLRGVVKELFELTRLHHVFEIRN